jgi:hypothetical protein
MLLAKRCCFFVEPQKKLVKPGLPCIVHPLNFSISNFYRVTGRGSSFMGKGITGRGKRILAGLQNRKFIGAHLVPQPEAV